MVYVVLVILRCGYYDCQVVFVPLSSEWCMIFCTVFSHIILDDELIHYHIVGCNVQSINRHSCA